MKLPGKIDLHMHTTVSDGTDTPEDILARVRAAGISLFSVTDHDAVKADRIIPQLRRGDDPLFLPGAEFSCRDEMGRYHILGYCFDPEAEAMRALVETGHRLRMNKVLARIDFLKKQFGFVFPEEDLQRLLAMDNPGRPHIANLMVRLGYAETKEQAIAMYISQLRFQSQFIRPEEVIGAILGSGGIPVLAHPCYGDGDQFITGEALDARIRHLTALGVQGLEAFYSKFTAKLSQAMLALAQRYDLYVTAGSDYHGANKPVALGDTGLGNPAEYPEQLCKFLRAIAERCGLPDGECLCKVGKHCAPSTV